MREADQLVGRVAHRREDADDLAPGLARRDEALRDLLQLLGVGHRRAAELHDNEPGCAWRVLDGREGFELRDGHLLQQSRQMLVRRWVAPFFFLIGLGLLPWTLYLVRSLKPDHSTGNWDLAWAGFDTLLAVFFILTAVAAWRRSSWIEACAAATGTLLLCDAWFDVVLESRGTELRTAVLEAVFVELPTAALCFWIARDAERFAREALTSLDGLTAPGPASPRRRTRDLLRPEGRSPAESRGPDRAAGRRGRWR